MTMFTSGSDDYPLRCVKRGCNQKVDYVLAPYDINFGGPVVLPGFCYLGVCETHLKQQLSSGPWYVVCDYKGCRSQSQYGWKSSRGNINLCGEHMEEVRAALSAPSVTAEAQNIVRDATRDIATCCVLDPENDEYRDQKGKLDLTQTPWFFGILLCKKALSHMNPGDMLEVVLDDADSFDDLIKIVNRSNDRIAEKSTDDKLYRLCIVKGETKQFSQGG